VSQKKKEIHFSGNFIDLYALAEKGKFPGSKTKEYSKIMGNVSTL
jgi:hypothetical protein